MRAEAGFETPLGLGQHGAAGESDCAAVLVDAGAREVAMPQQVQQVPLHLGPGEQGRAAPKVPTQARQRVDVGLSGANRHPAQLQRVQHALSQRCHVTRLDARAHARAIQGMPSIPGSNHLCAPEATASAV